MDNKETSNKSEKPDKSDIKSDRDAIKNQTYLDRLIQQATPRWEGMDADKWLRKLRGDYEL